MEQACQPADVQAHKLLRQCMGLPTYTSAHGCAFGGLQSTSTSPLCLLNTSDCRVIGQQFYHQTRELHQVTPIMPSSLRESLPRLGSMPLADKWRLALQVRTL